MTPSVQETWLILTRNHPQVDQQEIEDVCNEYSVICVKSTVESEI